MLEINHDLSRSNELRISAFHLSLALPTSPTTKRDARIVMSFNRLPNEIQRLIVSMCFQADQAYNEREGKGTNSSKTWNGRSCSAISMVSKNLRLMGVQYVFKLIKVSQMDKKMFLMWILDSPLCANFTTVEFNIYNPEKLQFALFHVLPRLPNLSAIWGIDGDTAERLFGDGGMARVSKLKYSSSTFNADFIHAWHKFKSIATRIVEWRVELKEEEVEALLSIDPGIKSQIRSLSLVTPEDEGFAILESNSSRFPALLSSLPSLASLSIGQASTLASNREYQTTISKVALSTKYPFCSTLTSFTWKGSRDDTTVDMTLLRLLARLESLRHLRIESSDFRIPKPFSQDDKPQFSQLETLELIGSGINDLDKVLDYVLLPRLALITLVYDLDFYERENLYDVDSKLAEDHYWRIFRFKETLRHVYLVARRGMYQVSLEHIKTGSFYGYKSEPPYSIHTNWQPGAAEVSTSENSRFQHYQVKIRDDEILDGIVAGVEELKLWVGDEIEGAQKFRDIPKAKQLFEALKPVWELREWSRD
ncbi:hypothetical protein JCM3765_005180 [Sporobolomyces pararoseus]